MLVVLRLVNGVNHAPSTWSQDWLLTVMRHCATVRPVPTSADLITATIAAGLLGKSPRTVQRLVHAGRLTPAIKLDGPNGAYLFNRADVERLAAPSTDDAA